MKQELFDLKKEINIFSVKVHKALQAKDVKYINFLISELEKLKDKVSFQENIEKNLANSNADYFFDSFSLYLLNRNIKRLMLLLTKKRK